MKHARTNERRVYRYGDVTVDSARPGLRFADGRVVDLRQKTFQVLLYLLEHRDRVVSRDELMEALWRDTVVTEGALAQCIVDIRRALGDDSRSPRFVKTFPKAGYQFVFAVDEIGSGVGVETEVTTVTEEVVSVAIEEVEVVEIDDGPAPAPLPAPAPPLELPAPGPRVTRQFRMLLGLLFVVACALGLFLVRRSRQPDVRLDQAGGRTPVAVLPFENRAGARDLDWLRDGLADMLITDLSRRKKLSVLSREQLHVLLTRLGVDGRERLSLETSLAIAARSHAALLVAGGFTRLGDRLRVDVQLKDGGTGRLVAGESLVVERLDQVLSEVDLLAVRLAARLGAAEETPRRLSEVTTSSLDAYRYYSLALESLQGLRTDEAIERLEKALSLDPDFAMARARIGYAHALAGVRADAARPYLAQALAGSRLTDRERLHVLAWSAIADLDYPRAVDAYRRLLRAHPDEVEAYWRLGRLLQGEERFAEAVDVLRQGLALDPDEPSLYNALGSVYSDLGRHDEAIDTTRRYVALAPRSPNAHDSLGLAYQWAGRYDEARAAYDRALDLDPGFGVAVVHLGNLEAEVGRSRKAVERYRRYIEVAREDWERIRGWSSIALVEVSRGDLRAAERAVAALGELPPSPPFAAWSLARARGDRADSERLAPLLFAEDRNTGRGQRNTRRVASYVLGSEALDAGQPEKALAAFREALRHRPHRFATDSLETCLADALLGLGRNAEAAREYERVLRLNPNHGRALFGLGRASERLGEAERARHAYERLLVVWKDADEDAPEIVEAKSALASGRPSQVQDTASRR